jgi:hypothetical protein
LKVLLLLLVPLPVFLLLILCGACYKKKVTAQYVWVHIVTSVKTMPMRPTKCALR